MALFTLFSKQSLVTSLAIMGLISQTGGLLSRKKVTLFFNHTDQLVKSQVFEIRIKYISLGDNMLRDKLLAPLRM